MGIKLKLLSDPRFKNPHPPSVVGYYCTFSNTSGTHLRLNYILPLISLIPAQFAPVFSISENLKLRE